MRSSSLAYPEQSEHAGVKAYSTVLSLSFLGRRGSLAPLNFPYNVLETLLLFIKRYFEKSHYSLISCISSLIHDIWLDPPLQLAMLSMLNKGEIENLLTLLKDTWVIMNRLPGDVTQICLVSSCLLSFTWSLYSRVDLKGLGEIHQLLKSSQFPENSFVQTIIASF